MRCLTSNRKLFTLVEKLASYGRIRDQQSKVTYAIHSNQTDPVAFVAMAGWKSNAGPPSIFFEKSFDFSKFQSNNSIRMITIFIRTFVDFRFVHIFEDKNGNWIED